MKTFRKLVSRFEHMYPDYEIFFDETESYSGFYRVCISDNIVGIPAWYTFRTCVDFREWMNEVILY
jgi:hypothetical protein